MLKVDLVHAIRVQVLQQGRSVRAVAREMRVSRNTVRRYLEKGTPVREESQPRPRPRFEAVRERLDELLEEWKGRTTAKQRVTGTRLVRALRAEGLSVGTTLVRAHLRELRRRASEAFVPLVHRPGDDALVDFFEIVADVGAERRKGYLFLMRLMHSGRDFAALYERQDQIAFLDGHVRAFEHFGGIPRRCVYDNLSAAVTKVVVPHRELTARFKALTNHYAFEACFARPGEGHDKGGVEGRGRGIRLEHLTPIPAGPSWREVSAELLARIDAEIDQRRDAQGRTVRERFEQERQALRPLPSTGFDARQVVTVSIPRTAVVQVKEASYSVPCEWKLLEGTAFVGPDEVTITCRGESTTKPRQARGNRAIRYRDYISELARKPQAVRQVAPELVDELGEPFGRLWQLLEQAHGGHEAGRVLAKILGAIHEHGEHDVREALSCALDAGRADLLALAPRLARSGPETVLVPAALAHHEVESARACDYDVLLAGGWP